MFMNIFMVKTTFKYNSHYSLLFAELNINTRAGSSIIVGEVVNASRRIPPCIGT